MNRYVLCGLSLLWLSACAGQNGGIVPAQAPYVQPSQAVLDLMASDAYNMLAAQYKPGPTIWAVQQIITDDFGQRLEMKFQTVGYGVQEYNKEGIYGANTVPLKYVVDNLLPTYPVLWRLKICAGDEVISRAFVESSLKSSGKPSPIGSWASVKEPCK